MDIRPILSIEPHEWFLPSGGCSLWKCLLRADNILEYDGNDILGEYIITILQHMSSLPALEEIFSDDDAAYLVGGETACPELILFTIAEIQDWEIKLSRIDEKNALLDSFTYEVHNPCKKIELVMVDSYYCLKLGDNQI